MTTPNDTEPKTDPENTESVAGAGCPASPCSAEWYRKRAEEVRHNGKTVTQYNHFLGVAEAIERAEMETEKLRGMLKQLIAFDDLMNDETWEDHGTYAGAYYAYYKGNYKTWDEARALLPNDRRQGPMEAKENL